MGVIPRPCLVVNLFYKMDIVILLFVFDKYILSNHGRTRLKRFILQITDKLCN